MFISALILVAGIQSLLAQSDDPGKVSGKIYSNLHIGMDHGELATAMEITRAYFGYERSLGDYFSAEVKLDIGSPDDISEYSRLRRYAYFKNAGITFEYNRLTAWAGLFDMLQFKTQENMWGYRYLYRSFMDEYRFGPSADLGLGAAYRFSPYLSADLVLSNGEGYQSPQRDNNYKTGLGLTIQPAESFTLRLYYSLFTVRSPQMTLSGFAGYTAEKFRVAAEYNHQRNYQFNAGYDRFGYSAYSTYIVNDRWEVFVRYDHLFSNVIEESGTPWNLPNDGSALLGGIQYTPVPFIHLAIDYRDWVDYASNGSGERYLFFHIEAVF
jgi:hypothetical protein